jgi:hypothetical protein
MNECSRLAGFIFFKPQAKALEELDAEFGVGELVEDEMRNERREAYSSRDLRGLRVEHAVVSIMFVKWFVLFF